MQSFAADRIQRACERNGLVGGQAKFMRGVRSGWFYVIESDPIPKFLGTNEYQVLSAFGQAASEHVSQMKPRAQQIQQLPSLSEAQQKAYDEILGTINQGGQRVLKGYAGTGKTTILQVLARDLPNKKIKAVFTAPTNKAVNVLQEKIDGPCMTIYKLLGLRVKKSRGEITLVQEGESKVGEFDVVFIDEASMLNSMVMSIIRAQIFPFVATIFSGDPKQLNPVNESSSQAFDLPDQSVLWDIIRQAEGNPIIEATLAIRKMRRFDAGKLVYTPREQLGGLGVFRLAGPTWKEYARECFTSQEQADNPDAFRVLAWRNKTVDAMNLDIHEILYGKTETPFCPGEVVLSRGPIAEGIVKTDEECVLADIKPCEVYGFGSWRLLLSTYNGTEVEAIIPRDEYKTLLLNQKDEYARKQMWPEFYELDDAFADLQHSYAMTVHRSQGSTFNNVFVNCGDILINQDDREVSSLLYVAMSRPRNSVICRY